MRLWRCKVRCVRGTVDEVEDVDVACNRCGRTCMSEHGERYGLSAIVGGGYESMYLEDMTTYQFDLCEK
jgi:hypothetical protein